MLEFSNKRVATVKAKDLTSTDEYSIQGITAADSLTPDNAAEQINKLFIIGGKSIAADDHMTRTITQEAVENG